MRQISNCSFHFLLLTSLAYLLRHIIEINFIQETKRNERNIFRNNSSSLAMRLPEAQSASSKQQAASTARPVHNLFYFYFYFFISTFYFLLFFSFILRLADFFCLFSSWSGQPPLGVGFCRLFAYFLTKEFLRFFSWQIRDDREPQVFDLAKGQLQLPIELIYGLSSTWALGFLNLGYIFQIFNFCFLAFWLFSFWSAVGLIIELLLLLLLA